MKKQEKFKKLVIEKYLDPKNPGSFSSLSRFLQNNPQFKNKKIKPILSTLESFSLHNRAKKIFKKRRVIVHSIDEQWQIDLIDVGNLKNKRTKQWYSFLFVCIDCFSHYGWAIPIKNKEADSCTEAFESILNELPKRKCSIIYSDSGNEFKGSFRKLLAKHNIKQIFSRSVHGAQICERFNQTIMSRLTRSFTDSNNTSYIETNFLKDEINSYNNTLHASIDMTPNQVNKNNQDIVFRNLYYKTFNEVAHIKYKKSDYVRINIDKLLFVKGYKANWSKDIYIISKILATNPITYRVKDLNDVENDSSLYTEELQKITYDEYPFDTYKVLQERNGKILITKLNSNEEGQAKEEWVDKTNFGGEQIENEQQIKDLQFHEEIQQEKKRTRSQNKKI